MNPRGTYKPLNGQNHNSPAIKGRVLHNVWNWDRRPGMRRLSMINHRQEWKKYAVHSRPGKRTDLV